MKKLSLIVTILALSFNGFGKNDGNTFFSIWTGAGVATKNNYNMGFSSGISYCKNFFEYRTQMGAAIFTQQYNIYYDKNTTNLVGTTIRNNSNYVFISPLFDIHLGNKGNTHVYLTAGPGFNISAQDTLRKWLRNTPTAYDSTIGNAGNPAKMVFRVGLGMTEYFYIGRHHYFFTITEDFGFLANKLSATTDVSNPQINNNVTQIYKPTYFSIRLGICRINKPMAAYQRRR